MSAVSKFSGLGGSKTIDVVRNRGNGEIGEGGGIIQDAPGGIGISESHVKVGYSA